MKSIKYKILVNFCIVAAVIITVIAIVVSWKISQSISQQSKMLANDLTARTNETLDGHHRILGSFIDHIKEDTWRNTAEICNNKAVKTSIELELIDGLENFLQSTCQTLEIDFGVVFDLNGTLLASFPAKVDKPWIESYYKSWKLGRNVQGFLSSGSENNTTELLAVSKHDSDFLKAFGLRDRDISGRGGISIASGGIIKDDIGDALGVCITGILLNRFQKPFEQLYNVTGSACMLCLDTTPIAQAGFKGKYTKGFDDSSLRISSEAQAEIYKADEMTNIALTLDGKKYLTTSSAIESFGGEKIGIVCVGVPEQKIIETQQTMVSYGHDTKRSVQAWLLGIGVVSLIIFVVVSLIIAMRIVRPTENAIDMIKDIAEGEGDLTKRLETTSSDEVGQLSKWFNIFIEKLQGIMESIARDANTLAESSEALSNLSSQMNTGVNKMSEKSNTVAASSEETSVNMTSVAGSAEQASTNVTYVATSVEEMTGTINEIAQNSEKARTITGKAVSEVNSASSRVNQLGRAAEEIGKVTETINEISEQTNLLALNATIEAARAGEAGKGFAVVANEIKELARQTAVATEEIKNEIEGIQGSTADTVADMEGISRVINEVNEIVSNIAAAVEEQSVTTKDIASNVSQVSHGIQEVTEKVGQSSNVAGEIAKDISEVNQYATDMANSSSQVNMSAEALSKLAEQLKEMVGKFRV